MNEREPTWDKVRVTRNSWLEVDQLSRGPREEQLERGALGRVIVCLSIDHVLDGCDRLLIICAVDLP